MLRSSLIAAGAVILGGAAAAQSVAGDLHRVQAPVKHAGIYHVATGTWTRNVPQAVNLGPDVVYNNTANSGYYSSLGSASQAPGESLEIVHNGRIPSLSATGAGANRDTYNVNGVDIGYCVGDDTLATGALTADITLYDGYDPCTDPTTALRVAGGFTTAGLPGATAANIALGYATCWIVQFDLAGGGEICLAGDADQVFDGDTAFDSFGFGVEFDPAGVGGFIGAVAVGPLLSGDRDWTVQAAGEITAPSVLGGGGGGDTYFGPAEVCLPALGGLNSSGYDTEDHFWVGFGPSSANAPGCYWFGGYTGNTACAADTNTVAPQASSYSALYADTTTCVIGSTDPTVHFCEPADNNSTGNPVTLSGSCQRWRGRGSAPGSQRWSAERVRLLPHRHRRRDRVPAGDQRRSPLPGGHRWYRLRSLQRDRRRPQLDWCLQRLWYPGELRRNLDLRHRLRCSHEHPDPGFTTIQAGDTWHFQLWYRDTPAGTGHSNLSNGVSYTF
ncbi:MAG: hypothetical protein R3E96_08315 [Planctomycetota bacterium]